MVWAKAKLMIHDDLLRPLSKVNVKFSGKTPERLYKEVYHLLLISFRIPEHSVQEREFVWTKGEPEKFNIVWQAEKDLDKFSYYWIEVSLKGETSKGVGNVEIVVDAALRTEYPQDTFWQRSLLYEFLRMTWHSTFYQPKRDEYMREGRRMLSSFLDQLKSLTRV